MNRQAKFVAPLPASTNQALTGCLQRNEIHPGLFLEKYVPTWNLDDPTDAGQEIVQKPAIERLIQLSDTLSKGLDFKSLSKRYQAITGRENTQSFQAKLISPLALHLARASALENASVCLHPIYGFAYIPGSGLKGMAHAYACEVWLPLQGDPAQAFEKICQVFGHTTSPWLRDLGRSLDDRFGSKAAKNKITAPNKSSSGAVVFHDAWPTACPKLIIDIVNNHHPEYYSAAESDNAHPPGDWENPKPVYFAAVAPGAAFEFAVTKRRANASDEMLDLARQWLAGALCNSGAGAKTNAGYGAFDANSISDAVLKEACDKTWSEAIDKKASRVQLDCTIELITPAFLAGANHDDPSECDLRSATLRGQLRWWWRTMHSGHVDSATLRRMEAAIWGDSKHGGAVRIIVEPEGLRNYELFEKRNKSALKRHEKCEQYGIRQANDPNKVTPGVAYLAYGMDEIRDGQPSQRYALMPGMKWSIRLIARPTEALSSEMILEQAKAALWLLSSYGGVGSKCRKGFGSLTTDRFPEYSIQMCEVGSSQVRRTLGYSGNRQLTPDGSSLTHRVEIPAVVFPWNDVWAVIEQVGFAYQSFAKRYSHRLSKTALGLPRRTRANANDRFEPTGAFKQHWDKTPTRDRLEKLRFASPIHFHFERIHGGFVVKAIAFVQSTLPNTQASKMILDEFVQEMETELQCRAKLPPRSVAGSSSQPSKASTSTEGVRRATPTVNIPEIAHDQLKDRLANTQLPHVLLKASQTTTGEKCPCQLLKLAPKVPAGWQTVGDWQLADAPPGLPEGTIVLAVTENRIAKFQEVVGRLPSLQKNTGSKLPGNRRR